MLKVILLSDAATAKIMMQKLQGSECKVVAILNPDEYDNNILHEYKADLIVTNTTAISWLIQSEKKSITPPRQQVKAVTHQGIRLVPVANVFYFQAEHKYVNAFHTHGQLLIEDTLNGLEQEFADAFIRIHRKTLVAKNKIETLMKASDGQYYIKLHGREESLLVSRRQLPLVRKVIKWL